MTKSLPLNSGQESSLLTKKFSITLLLILILLFSIYIRRYTFWTSHWRGDQNTYLGLAMKLEKYGFGEYNIRGIDTGAIPLNKDNSIYLLAPVPAAPGAKGTVLEGLIKSGAAYYDTPLFQNAPAFPYALMFSHKLFAQKDQLYLAAFSNDNKLLMDLKLQIVRQAQFYAVIVPLLFFLLTMIAIFSLGSYLFSPRIGLHAALIYSVNPVNLMTSQKIWADDMLTFFTILAVIIFLTAVKKNFPFIAFFAGLSCGIATLTKQSGILLIPAMWLFLFILNMQKIRNLKSFFSVILNVYFLLFFAGFLISTFFWFYKVYTVYGNPLYVVDTGNVILNDKTGWFKAVASRPHPYIFFSVGIPYLCPIFILAYFSIINFLKDLKLLHKDAARYAFIMLWFWILAFYLLFTLAKEHRYMMPIYPSLAILSAYYLDRIRNFLKFKVGVLIGEVAVIVLLVMNALYTIPTAMNVIVQDGALFLKPF